jgi:CheY-like chemotaxis protein
MNRLLVVDDDNVYRQFLSMALELSGYSVQTAGNGAQAISILQDVSPDLVLLDLSMPVVSGWDVLRFMRDQTALECTPVVVLTANADETTRLQTSAERVNGLLVKPVSLDEILTTIETLLADTVR